MSLEVGRCRNRGRQGGLFFPSNQSQRGTQHDRSTYKTASTFRSGLVAGCTHGGRVSFLRDRGTKLRWHRTRIRHGRLDGTPVPGPALLPLSGREVLVLGIVDLPARPQHLDGSIDVGIHDGDGRRKGLLEPIGMCAQVVREWQWACRTNLEPWLVISRIRSGLER